MKATVKAGRFDGTGMDQNAAGMVDPYIVEVLQVGGPGIGPEPGAKVIAGKAHNGSSLFQPDGFGKMSFCPLDDFAQVLIPGRETVGLCGRLRGGQLLQNFKHLQQEPRSGNRIFIQPDHLQNQFVDGTVGITDVGDAVNGFLILTEEGFDKAKADLLKKALNSAARYGLAGMPKADLARMGYAMLRYKMNFKDGVALYGKYVGNWGGEATVWRFDAIVGGEVVKSVTCCPSAKLHLEAIPSHIALKEGATYDMAAVRIRVLDEFGNVAPYAQLPIRLTLEGAAELIGPDVVVAEGGMCGAYIRTAGKAGTAKLTLSTDGLEQIVLEFEVK